MKALRHPTKETLQRRISNRNHQNNNRQTILGNHSKSQPRVRAATARALGSVCQVYGSRFAGRCRTQGSSRARVGPEDLDEQILQTLRTQRARALPGSNSMTSIIAQESPVMKLSAPDDFNSPINSSSNGPSSRTPFLVRPAAAAPIVARFKTRAKSKCIVRLHTQSA